MKKSCRTGFMEFAVLAVVALAAGLGFFVVNASRGKTLQTKPTSSPDLPKVNIYINPKSGQITKKTDLSIVVNSGLYGIGFVKTVVLFDNKKLQLTKDIVLSDKLTTAVKIDKYQLANKQGRMEIVLGLAPRNPAPSGVFELGKLSFEPVTKKTSDTKIYFDKSDVQVVAIDSQSLGVNFDGSEVKIN